MTSRISFRRLGRDDFPLLTTWLNTPHVCEWWGVRAAPGSLGGAGPDAATLELVAAKFGEELAGPDVRNERSVRAFEKAGFGVARDATVTGGGSARERVMVRDRAGTTVASRR